MIDYPVMQGKDNSWFLSRNYKGEFSGAGSIFFDWRHEFDDDVWLIYGHSMSNEWMFSELAQFADFDYLEGHRKGKIWLRDETFEIRWIFHATVDANTDAVYDTQNYKKGRKAELWRALGRSEMAPEEKVIILSTCSKKERRMRDILVGVLFDN